MLRPSSRQCELAGVFLAVCLLLLSPPSTSAAQRDAVAWADAAQRHLANGEVQQAAEAYRRAIELQPNWLEWKNELAWLLATTDDVHVRNPQQALLLAEVVSEATLNSHAGYLHTLAAAQAAAGRFEAAAETAERAVRQARIKGDEPLALEAAQLAVLYRSGQAYSVSATRGHEAEAGTVPVSKFLNQLKLDDDFAELAAHLALGLTLTNDPQVRDAEQAHKLALAACEASGYVKPTPLAALAAAEAEAGSFRTAERHARQALQYASLPGLRADIERQIARYSQNLPMRLNAANETAAAQGSPRAQRYLLLASLLTQAARPGDAIAALRQAVELDASFGAARGELGRLLFATGKREEGLKTLRDAVQASPDDRLIQVYLAAACQQAGDSELAEQHYRRALELEPHQPAVAHDLAQLLLAEDRDAEGALKFAQYACEHSSFQNTDWLETLARAQEVAQQPQAAVHTRRMAVDQANQQRMPEVAHRFQRKIARQHAARHEAVHHVSLAAKLLRETGEFGAAIDLYRRAHRQAPERLDVANNLAWLLATAPDGQLREPQTALELARQIVAADGDSPAYLDTLAAAEAATGDFARAADILRRALQLTPQSDVARQLRWRLCCYEMRRPAVASRLGADSAAPLAQAARTCKQHGRYREAILLYEAALHANPELLPLMNNLAWLLATCTDAAHRDPAYALRLAEVLRADEASDDFAFLDTHAAALAAAGRFAEAEAVLSDAVELARNDETRGTAALPELELRLEQYRHHEPHVDAPAQPATAATLAALAQQLRHAGDLQKAVGLYREAIHLGASTGVVNNYAWLLAVAADGRVARPAEALRLAEQLNAGEAVHPELLDTLAAAQAAGGDYTAAIATTQQAIAAADQAEKPQVADILRARLLWYEARLPYHEPVAGSQAAAMMSNIGFLLERIGEPQRAAEYYRQAHVLAPGELVYADNLAWLLATSPRDEIRQPEVARRLAERNCRQTGIPSPEFMDTLAAAYAAEGDFERARDIALRALKQALANGQSDVARQLAHRLDFYDANEPYLALSSAD